MPTKYVSYLSGLRCFATSWADLTETGCSSEVPPKMIATFTLSMTIVLQELQAVDECVFNDVLESVICVVGRVGGDQHIR